MTAIAKIKDELCKLGYSSKTIAHKYRFADLLSDGTPVREVALAAFTDTPVSYRNAAFGVIDSSSDPGSDILSLRALGASVWFCISGDKIEVWNTESNKRPKCTDIRPLDEIENLFLDNKDYWLPDRIHSAKFSGLWDGPAQLSFIDFGLLRVLEHCTQENLDRAIRNTLKALIQGNDSSSAVFKGAYRICFYFLAAKILHDRQHRVSRHWNFDDAQSVLNTIQNHYQLKYLTTLKHYVPKKNISQAWSVLKDEVNFANISADDLAFVYENTLVSPETRKRLGTHSTPRSVAEFLVSRLQIGRTGQDTPKIYEPFCGSGVLSVAALSALRSNLPRDWSEAKRHNFLVKHLRASDVDPFACEVASLSFILADYPSANGWDIRQADLFSERSVEDQIEPGMIVLCNPPFEDFTFDERRQYAEAAALSLHKPIHVLKKILASSPEAIGFVLPHAIISDRKYLELRKELEAYFSEIELIALPDRVFVESEVESALLIGKSPRDRDVSFVSELASATVKDSRRESFLVGAFRPRFHRRSKLTNNDYDGELWVSEFSELWEYLDDCPKLGDFAKFHRGIEWQSGYQTKATSIAKKEGYKTGLHSSKNLMQFHLPQPVYLDCRKEFLRGGAVHHPWEEPKVILNAARKSRGAWRLAACTDENGWVLSQQLIGCWVKDGDIEKLPFIEAILNSPISSTYVSGINSRKRFNLKTIENIPIPKSIDFNEVALHVKELHDLSLSFEMASPDRDMRMKEVSLSLDAVILSAYDLPAKLERQLLVSYQNESRPIGFDFGGYPISTSGMAMSLGECLSGKYSKNKGDWIRDVFQPLPRDERDMVVKFL